MGKLEGCRPTIAEINLAALSHNIKTIKDNLDEDVQFMAVVKANAYGHGAVPIAKKALEVGATYLGVATLGEGIQLREAGIDAPILVFGYTSPDCYPIAQELDIALTFFNLAHVEQALECLNVNQNQSKDQNPLKVHVKIDTGMGRIGFTNKEAFLQTCQKISDASCLSLEGVFTHFACADEEDALITEKQVEMFDDWIDGLKAVNIQPTYLHVNNSAGTIRFPKWGKSLCRVGISLYGLHPSGYICEHHHLPLHPVLTLKTEIVHLKEVPSGTPISYGGTYRTHTTAHIATIPIGYGDGYSRGLSNIGEVLIHGQRAKIAGRVAMDQIMIDVTHIEGVSVGDEVILIGKQGNDEITADEVAVLLGTINYEVVSALGPRIERRVVE